jgi:leucyl aminopeptidase (aminopeptidase T)
VTVPVPYDYQTDWTRMARLIVREALQTQPGERVLLHADPTYFPALTEAVRIEVNRAGAVELATHMLHPPGLERVRQELRRRGDPGTRALEDRAMAALFDLADIYIWLPTSWAYNVGQTEEILTTWRGRAIHFHWIMETGMEAGLFRTLSRYYDEALYLDTAALTAHQRRVVAALRDRTVEITDPRGTRLAFQLPQAHFHLGNGDASKAFIDGYARPGSARDREVELPCGAIRTVDIAGAEGVLVTPPETFGGRRVGRLRIEFRGDRIVGIESEHHAAWVRAVWGAETGDKDRIGEFNVGVSPRLRMLPGVDYIPYYGYGAGIVRLSLGDNAESGGRNRSSYHHWVFLTDATVRADGRPVIEAGELVLP